MPRREQRLAQASWDERKAVVKARARGKCGSRTRHRPPRPCSQSPMPNGRCRLHGGESTGPPWKHGQYSKELEPFRAMLRGRALDPELLHGALFEKLALLDEAEDALLARGFSEGDTPGFRQEALKLFRKGAAEARDEDLSTPLSWEHLGELLEKGAEYDRVLAEAAAMAGKRMKQTVDLRAVMSQEESAAHRLACKLQIVVGVVYQVLGEELGVKKAEPIIGAVHQRLLGGKARGLVLETTGERDEIERR